MITTEITQRESPGQSGYGESSADQPQSLAACERLLRHSLGAGAPALITMRRHAKAGLLDECIASGIPGRRTGPRTADTRQAHTRYRPSRILAHYQANPPQVSGAQASAALPAAAPVNAAQGQGVPEASGAEDDEAKTTLRELRSRLATARQENLAIKAALNDLAERVTSLGAQVRDLNAVRVALMTKYDAAAAAANERAERLEQENKTLRRMEDPNARVLARIQMDLAKVLGTLESRD
jgi:hypothetical protein